MLFFRKLETALIGAVFFMSACAGSGTGHLHGKAISQLSLEKGFHSVSQGVQADSSIFALQRGLLSKADTLRVYIEGDGAPWVTPYHPPKDPTPEVPVAFEMATEDAYSPLLYLGRPCQYLEESDLAGCDPKYWTTHRFSSEVLERYDFVLTALKIEHGIKHFELIGYSGGGVLAMLLGGHRKDVIRVVTVASPLALNQWTGWHGVSGMPDSIDPSKASFAYPESIHFFGAKDRVVPFVVSSEFITKIGARYHVIPRFNHDCCWAGNWKTLLRMLP
jgi:hypothetical protein